MEELDYSAIFLHFYIHTNEMLQSMSQSISNIDCHPKQLMCFGVRTTRTAIIRVFLVRRGFNGSISITQEYSGNGTGKSNLYQTDNKR